MMLVGSWIALGARDDAETEREPLGSSLGSRLQSAAELSAAQIGSASDRIVLLAQNTDIPTTTPPTEPGEQAAAGADGPAPDQESGGESLLPGAEGDAEGGESLLPGSDEDDGESLLPGGDEGDGYSLLPDLEGGGDSLLPDSGDSDLFPPGAADSVPAAELGAESGSGAAPDPLADAGETAAAAHTTYLKWLQEEKRFPTAVTCAKCHPDHFAEWSVSAHAYAQMSPVFNSMHATLLKATSGTNGDFCIRCHTQIGMQREEKLFTSNLKRHPASIEGITCVVCHRVDRAYGKVSGRTAIVEGDLLQPVYGPKGNAILKAAIKDTDKYKIQDKDIDGPRPVHADAKKFDPIATSGFCGSCHDVNLLNGFRLEEAFSQFKNSPSHKRGENCQDCHMGVIPGIAKPKGERFASAKKGGKNEHLSLQELRASSERDMNYAFGPAALVGDERTPTPARKRTNHHFAGPDYSIIHPGLFPHSPQLKDFTYQGRIARHLSDAEEKAEEAKVPFDRNAAEVAAVAQAKEFSLADWLSFRWEDGWGTDAFEDAEKDRARADAKAAKDGKTSGWQSIFANLPAKEREVLVAAGWHDPDPSKWRKGARAERCAPIARHPIRVAQPHQRRAPPDLAPRAAARRLRRHAQRRQAARVQSRGAQRHRRAWRAYGLRCRASHHPRRHRQGSRWQGHFPLRRPRPEWRCARPALGLCPCWQTTDR
jgi:nitrate/TMAO reductase-like tetraheme cytochrome c subunit